MPLLFFVFVFFGGFPRYFWVAVIADGICIYTFVSKWYFRSAIAVVVVLHLFFFSLHYRGDQRF